MKSEKANVIKKTYLNLSANALQAFFTWKDSRGGFRYVGGETEKFFSVTHTEYMNAQQTGVWPKAEISQSIGEPTAKKRYKARSGYEGTLNLDRYQSYSQEPYDTHKKRKTYKPCRIGIQCNLGCTETTDRLAGICTELSIGINQLTESGYSVSIDSLNVVRGIFTATQSDEKTIHLMTLHLKTEDSDYDALEILSHKSFPRTSTFACIKSVIDTEAREDWDRGLGYSVDNLPADADLDYDIIIKNQDTKDTVRQAIQSLLDQ